MKTVKESPKCIFQVMKEMVKNLNEARKETGFRAGLVRVSGCFFGLLHGIIIA